MSKSVHEMVRERYAATARGASRAGTSPAPAGAQSCCGGSSGSEGCCSGPSSTSFGYTIDQLAQLPPGADLSLGCGNPTALASIVDGEVVVDLGSGGGIDCFLAARRAGPSGRVIGVDMTPEMLHLARSNAEAGGYTNVEFRLGEIEHLPVADSTADLIISNCVVNLSPDKPQVLREALRVLRPGGRLMISDLVLTAALPDGLERNLALLTGCIAGAMLLDDFLAAMQEAGFTRVEVIKQSRYVPEEHVTQLAADAGITPEAAVAVAASLRSASIAAWKPAGTDEGGPP